MKTELLIDSGCAQCYNSSMKIFAKHEKSLRKWLTLKTSVISTTAEQGGSAPFFGANGLLIC